jgi:hypothetical protein
MRRILQLLLAAGVLACCGGGTAAAARAPQKTEWLCFPGRAGNPCETSLRTTVLGPDGSRKVTQPRPAPRPAIDCFYVYPTVSQENSGNADRSIGLAQILVAQTQAAPFSRVCRVYAPVYRQITERGLTTPSLHADPYLAYGDVLQAWRDYLSHWNHGRGVVLIGHSQGAYVLKHLLAATIDPSAAQRRLLVSAILLGGQVHAADTPAGASDTGSTAPCTSASAIGCVIAFSSFGGTPPPGARFGRSRLAGTQIVCVNPVRPGSTAAEPLTPLVPTAIMRLAGVAGAAAGVITPWVSYPGLFTARCKRAGNASWLQVTRIAGPADPRPALRPLSGAGWGLHATDMNIALGDLVSVVRSEGHAYAGKRSGP